MSNFTPFLSCVYPLALLQQRVKIIQSLVHYVTFSWRDTHSGLKNQGVDEFSRAVQAEMAPYFFNLIDVPKSRRKGFTQPLDTTEHVLSAFESAAHFNDHELIAVPHFNDKTMVEAFKKRFADKPFQARFVNCNQEEEPTVAGSLRMAQNNFVQNQTRRLSVSVIYELLRANSFSQQESLAQEGALLHHLHASMGLAIRDMMLFGGMLGGNVQKEVIKFVARHTCHKEDTQTVRYSVMHFINSDRRRPGIHMAKTADALKTDIKTHYEAL